MANPALFNVLALAALIPATLVSLRSGQRGKDGLFLALLGLAIAGPVVWAVAQLSDQWRTGLSTTLWVIIAGSLVLFGLLVATVRQAWRLSPLLLPYLMLLGMIAALFRHFQGGSLTPAAPMAWLEVHILVAVATFGLFTMAAVAALAAFLQERALKTKRPTGLTRALPSVADSESLANRLLAGAELVLGLGLVTGMATLYLETGSLLRFNHKVVLSILAFVMIGALLVGHRVCGVRGRWAARLVMVAYLLLMLALPGVKFVRDVLLS
jgi:ABC-type uncharacterized transport system permease subunit